MGAYVDTERATVELAPDGPALPALRAAVAASGYTVPEEITAISAALNHAHYKFRDAP